MKFNYKYDPSLENNDLRDAFKEIGAKSKDTKQPKIIPNNYEHSIEILETLANFYPSLNKEILKAFKKHKRYDFLNWEKLSDDVKVNYANNPNVFMAIPFHENNTISSIHGLFLRGSLLELESSKRIYEIGAKSGYDCIIFAESMKDGKVVGFESDLEMKKIAIENIKKTKMEDKVTIISKETPFDVKDTFDRISSPYVLKTTKGIEQILSLLKDNGMARLSIARVGNVLKASEAEYFEPGMELESKDIHIKPNDPRQMVRATTYVFKKDGENIRYAFNKTGGLSPIAYWE